MELDKMCASTVIPSRTRYQLRQFVVGQHDTTPMRWRQILLEAQDLMFKIRVAEINLAKARITIDRLRATGDAVDALDADEAEVGAVLTERTLAGARIELQWLAELADEVGAHTFEEIEADQPRYWALRLDRQAVLDKLGAVEGVSPGNLAAMLNAGLISRAAEELGAGEP